MVRLGEVADVVLGAEDYEQDVRFNGEAATFMACGRCRPRTRSTSSRACATRSADPGAAAGRHEDRRSVRLDEYIRDSIKEGLRTLTRRC